jgi:4-hydroxythreonine-4-phosphate dehydrogenase
MSHHPHHEKPVVAISIGDFNGIGPEVILKTFSDARILKLCTPVIYGNFKIFAKYKKIIHHDDIAFHSIKSIDDIHHKKVNIKTCWEEDFEITPGVPTKESGKCAFLSLEHATRDVLQGKAHLLLTAPLDKKNIQNEDFNFPGHTEYLAAQYTNKEPLMLMAGEHLKLCMVTAHVPLKDVSKMITKELLNKKLNVLMDSMHRDFGVSKPKIAVLGLNPHAGEKSLLGSEEAEIISPVIKEWKEKGHLIQGPFSSDGYFASGTFSKFDATLAMYHDQGLIGFKIIDFQTGINFTAGLPMVRTSPDHGTAYDIAGKNVADEGSFREALYRGLEIVKNRAEYAK